MFYTLFIQSEIIENVFYILCQIWSILPQALAGVMTAKKKDIRRFWALKHLQVVIEKKLNFDQPENAEGNKYAKPND